MGVRRVNGEQPDEQAEQAEQPAERPRETSGLSAEPMTPEQVDARWYLAVDEESGWKVVTGTGETIARGLHYRDATLIARTYNRGLTDV